MEQALISEIHSLRESNILQLLKSGTQAAHKALEQLPLSVSLTDPAITKQSYVNYLQHMLPLLKDAEQNVYPLLTGIVPDLHDRNKSGLILQDLQRLGATVSYSNEQPFSGSSHPITVPRALGIAYVIEGSTLGGRFILKNVTTALGYTADNGAGYFTGYGENTGRMWKGFCEALTRFDSENDSTSKIIDGANFAFARFYDYFNR